MPSDGSAIIWPGREAHSTRAHGRLMANLSFISPKAEKRQSPTHGRGLFAREVIAKGEVVAVKGGYVMTAQEWAAIKVCIGAAAEIYVSNGLVIAPRSREENEGSMLHLNHSCEPNIGVEGQIVFVTMRNVEAGEELVIDYAMIDDFDGEMTCLCRTPSCRKIITGQDWRNPELQRRYQGYFSAYLQKRFAESG
jgi:uncharacterized protein